MTEQAFDALLRKALMDAVMEDFGPVWNGEPPVVDWSPRYKRKMRRLLDDPFREIRRRARPAWKRGLRAAACAVLISAALFAATIAAVPQARAWVRELWTQWFETNTRYGFTGESRALDIHWRLDYLPFGYTESSADETESLGTVVYTNQDGDEIFFDYKLMQDGTIFSVNNEHSKYKPIYLDDGTIADLYSSNDPSKVSFILWTDIDGDTAFQLMAAISSDELIKMAESAYIIEN